MTGNILITGGAGFIGSRIAAHLGKQTEPDVIVLDVRAEDGQRGNVRTMRGDVFNPDQVLKVLRGDAVSQVIHMVGLASIPDCREHPDKSYKLNVASVQSVLEAMRKEDVDHLVFPSTAAVYGDVTQEQVDEMMEPRPTSIYGCHKVAAEALIHGYARDYGIKSTILRVFNVYGDFLKEQGVVSAFVRKALEAKPLMVNGGVQLRDFVHIRDVVTAFVESLGNGKAYQRIINVGSGVGLPVREVAEMVCQSFPKAEVVCNPLMNGEYSIYADVSEMRALLGCEALDPRVGIPDFVEKCKSDYTHR